jgi:hypothetical protein
MDFSFNAIHRIAMREGGKEKFKDRVFLDDGRSLSDQKLIDKLKSFGVNMNKNLFHELSERYLSAEEMFSYFFDEKKAKVEGCNDEDWLWICLTVLWERWEPGKPSFEMIDNEMQNGYDLIDAGEVEKGCELWMKVWGWIRRIMKEQKILHINEFEAKFKGTQLVENWLYDFEMELGNAGMHNPKFHNVRIDFANDFIKEFIHEDINLIRVMKRSLAESHHRTGNIKEMENLFENWLEKDDTWGWGWIGYSDCYWLKAIDTPDYEKAEQILKRALDIPDVEERDQIIERLTDLYDETNRPGEAEKLNEYEQIPEPPVIQKVNLKIPSGKKKKKR